MTLDDVRYPCLFGFRALLFIKSQVGYAAGFGIIQFPSWDYNMDVYVNAIYQVYKFVTAQTNDPADSGDRSVNTSMCYPGGHRQTMCLLGKRERDASMGEFQSWCRALS